MHVHPDANPKSPYFPELMTTILSINLLISKTSIQISFSKCSKAIVMEVIYLHRLWQHLYCSIHIRRHHVIGENLFWFSSYQKAQSSQR